MCSAIEKEVARIHKKWRQNYRKYILLQFIDDVRFMANLELNVNMDLMIKKCGTCGIKYQHCNSFFENTNFKYDLIEYICLCCNKKYQQKVKETNF